MNAAILLINKISSFQRKKLTFTLLGNLMIFLICLLCLWLVTLVTDRIFYLSSLVRWLVLLFNLVITTGLFILLLVGPLLSHIRMRSSANLAPITQEIGYSFQHIQDRLTNIYQLMSRPDDGSSPQLKEYAVAAFYKHVQDLDFNKSLRPVNFFMPVPTLLAILAGSIFILTTLDLSIAFKRIFNPDQEFAQIPAFSFETKPGNSELILGQQLDIVAGYTGPAHDGCLLLYRNQGESTFQQVAMHPDGKNYQAALVQVRKPLEYRIKSVFKRRNEWSDRIVSDLYQIRIIIPPLVSELNISVSPPDYTGLPQQFLEKNIGDLLVYPGTRIDLSASSNKKLKSARIVFADSSVLDTRVRENKIQAQFQVKQSNTYSISLVDEEGNKSQNPITYSISLLEDLYPAVDLIEPGSDVEIPADGALNLLIEGRDDFGFSDLKLHYQIISSSELAGDTSWQEQPVSFPSSRVNFFQQNFFWNFAPMNIGFEDAVKYYVSLEDNDPVRGPKRSRSEEYFIHFPSLETLFSTFAEQQSQRVKEMEQVTNESEDLKKKLEEINRELKRDDKMDWERKKEIESALKKQNEVQEKLDQIQQHLEEAIQKLESAQLLNPDLLEKYRQLQQLFQEIATPELLQAMEELQKSMEKLSDNQIKTALQKLQLNQQQFKERLDRTLELFKRVQLEQEMDRLVQTAKKMAEDQQKISDALNREKQLPANDLADIENETMNQQKTLQQMQANLNELTRNELLHEYKDILQNLESAGDLIDQQKIKEQLENMRQMIRQSNQQQAGQQSKQTEQNLQQLHSSLRQAQQNMNAMDQARLLSKMQKVSENLLQLSASQEMLMEETGNFSDLSAGFRDMANRQQSLSENMNGTIKEIIDLSHQTFFIQPGLSKSLGKASGGMRKTLEELQNRNQAAAGKSQEQAMAGLNESVMGMQNSMQQMTQSNSALGFEQFMQSLQKMSGQQGQLNEESMNFFNGAGNQGALSVQQQQELRRLAAEQRSIQQALEQLSQEGGNRSDILGRLDNLAQEMEKIVQDMESMKMDRKTLERQQQVFTRLLDAQKSVREKEYSRDRQAETGKNYARKSPTGKMDPVNQRAQKLRQDLQRALQEGYHPDYEKLIEDYFKALSQIQSPDKN